MKKILFTIAGLITALAVACAGSTPVPPAATFTQAPDPTPMGIQEWQLRGISVEGNTVTVSLLVFAGIAVRVTLDGNHPSRVDDTAPILDFVFEDVTAGEHPIEIKDVVGFIEKTSVKVEAPDPVNGDLPDWLTKWVADLEAGRVEFPPQSITRYQYGAETVYYVLPQCCDQFSDLLDAGGNLIGHPDGGITGRGDGATMFSPSDLEGEEIWPGR